MLVLVGISYDNLPGPLSSDNLKQVMKSYLPAGKSTCTLSQMTRLHFS